MQLQVQAVAGVLPRAPLISFQQALRVSQTNGLHSTPIRDMTLLHIFLTIQTYGTTPLAPSQKSTFRFFNFFCFLSHWLFQLVAVKRQLERFSKVLEMLIPWTTFSFALLHSTSASFTSLSGFSLLAKYAQHMPQISALHKALFTDLGPPYISQYFCPPCPELEIKRVYWVCA